MRDTSPTGVSDLVPATFSSWVNLDSDENTDSDSLLYLYHYGRKTFRILETSLKIETTQQTTSSTRTSRSTDAITTGTPYFIAATYNSNDNLWQLYINGSEVSYDTQSAGSGTDTSDSGTLYLTSSTNNFNGNLPGYQDEFRIASAERNADWISAEYTNQNTTTTFYITTNEDVPVTEQSAKIKIDNGAIKINGGRLKID